MAVQLHLSLCPWLDSWQQEVGEFWTSGPCSGQQSEHLFHTWGKKKLFYLLIFAQKDGELEY